MASAIRPTLLRQALAIPSKRAFSSTATAKPAIRSPLQRSSFQLVQRAAFKTTTQRALLPPLPQRISGDVNQAASVPFPEPSHGSYHWTAERVLSVALVPLTVAPFAAGALNPTLDGLLIGTLLIHSHMGFQSIITDYLPRWRVPKTRRIVDLGTYLALVVVGWGWYEFETNDVGLTEAIRRIWMARRTQIASS